MHTRTLASVLVALIIGAVVAVTAASIAQANNENQSQQVNTSWSCLKRQFTDNPCPDKGK